MQLYIDNTPVQAQPGQSLLDLAKQLGLTDLQVFLPEEAAGEGTGLGTAGELPREMDREELLQLMREKLGQQHPRYNNVQGSFTKAAVVSGAGGEFFREAKQAGIGVLITGEAKYNHFIDAAQMGILLIEAGHFETERMFIREMAAHLTEYFKDEEIGILCAEVTSPCMIG